MVDDAKVMNILTNSLPDERTNAGSVHFDRQVIIFGMLCGQLPGRIAHTGANVKDLWRRPAKMLSQVKCCSGKINAVMLPVFFKGLGLAACQAPSSQDKAAYCA